MRISATAAVLCSVTSAAGTSCDSSGASSTYTESIEDDISAPFGKARHILASGCPNHVSYAVGSNPNVPRAQNKDVSIPAYPCLSDLGAFDVNCVGGAVGITLNGVSIFSRYAGSSCSIDAVQEEGDTFDSCSGHATGQRADYQYHYHIAPSCLLQQLNATQSGQGHSPLIGWAYDGFPVYGPHGIDGESMFGCSHNSAEDSDCVDSCNGHAQHEIAGFLYHYHILGPIGDLTSSPVSPLPGTDMSPYTIGCLKGVPLDWDILGCGNQVACNSAAQCSGDGTTQSYVATAVDGVTAVFAATANPTAAGTESPSGGPLTTTMPPTMDSAASQVKILVMVCALAVVHFMFK